MNQEENRAFAKRIDQHDPLRELRNEFIIPKTSFGMEKIYFCGNSLGLQPRGARKYAESILEAWEAKGVDAHMHGENPWLTYHDHLTEMMARIVGARPDEIVLMNGLSVNLHLMMVSFYRPTGRRHKILMEHKPFPSDLYAAKSQIRFHGYDPALSLVEWQPRPGEETLETEDLEEILRQQGDSIALVLLSGVNYYTGQAYELKRIAEAARAQGCHIGLDLAHAAGNTVLKLHDWDIDFAVWCSYKYLNSGPGSLGGCFVHERYRDGTGLPRFEGWWGNKMETRFQMDPDFDPSVGAAGWQISNTSPMLLAMQRAALEIFERVGIESLRNKSEALTFYLEFLFDQMPDEAYTVITPRHPDHRGAQLSIRINRDGQKVFETLTNDGVVCDWRNPDVIRVAPVPLYNSFIEIFEFIEKFKRALNL
jgi:kynureninase